MNNIFIIEESTPGGTWSSEIITNLIEKYPEYKFKFSQITSLDEIIPSSKHLEKEMLVNKDKIYKSILKMFNYV